MGYMIIFDSKLISFMSIVGISPKGHYPVAQYRNGASKKWEKPNPRRILQQCADACRKKNGCRGFDYANSGNDQGACGIYTGGDDDRVDPVWYTCVVKSTLSG